jgi:acyl-CoA reductase-like NAD-dependent aldehyde dehydrogenase
MPRTWRVWRVAEALDSGMVGVKTGLIADEMAPFRGIRQSGLSSPRLTTLYGESVSAIGW